MRLRRRRFLELGAAALAAAPSLAWAQTYPDRAVRMIVPYAAGGPTDVITRLVAQRLSEHVGKQFFVENVGGGGGNIGMGRAAKSPPDGYTLLVVNPSYVINPTLYDKVPYEFEKDFDPVTLMVATTLVITVHPSVPAQTIEGPHCPDQSQSRQIQLRVAGHGHTGTSRRRNVPALARPRPRACPVQQRGPGGRRVGRGPYADLFRLAVAGRAASHRGSAARRLL